MGDRVRRIYGTLADIGAAPLSRAPVVFTLIGAAHYLDTASSDQIGRLTRTVQASDGTQAAAPAAIASAVATTGGALDDGTYYYVLTDEPFGVESAASVALSVVVTGGGGAGAVTLAGIPAPVSGSVGRNLYRARSDTPPTADLYHLVAVLTDPLATGYTDVTNDGAITATPGVPTGPAPAGFWQIAVIPTADLTDPLDVGAPIQYTVSLAGGVPITLTPFDYSDGSAVPIAAIFGAPSLAGITSLVYLDLEDILTAPVSGTTLTLQLNQDAIAQDTGRRIFAARKIVVFFDGAGHASAHIKPNDLLTPAGTFYTVTAGVGGEPFTVAIPSPDPINFPLGYDLNDTSLWTGTAQGGMVRYSETSLASTPGEPQTIVQSPPLTLDDDLRHLRHQMAADKGKTLWTDAAHLVDNPMTTAWDLIVGGTAGVPTRFGLGPDNAALGVSAGHLAWLANVVLNPMTALGSLIVGALAGAPAELPIGAEGTKLTVISGMPAWHDDTPPPPPVPPPEFVANSTAALHSPDAAVPTQIDDLSLTVTPTATTNYQIRASVLFTKATGAIHLAIRVDGVQVFPDPANGPAIWAGSWDAGTTSPLFWPNWQGGEAALQAAELTTVVALTAGSHTIKVYWQQSSTTDDITFYDRSLWALPVVSPGPVNPMLTIDDLIIGGTGGTPLRLVRGAVGTLLGVGGDAHVNWLTPTELGLVTNPLTSLDDLIVGGLSGVPARLAVGTVGQVLGVNGSGHVAYIDQSGGLTNPMTTVDDLIIGGTAGAPARLGVGAVGRFLGVGTDGHLAYLDPGTGGGGGGMTNPMTAVNQLIVGGTGGTPVALNPGTDFQVLGIDGSGNVAYLDVGGTGAMTNPMNTLDDLIVGGTAGAPARLAKGSVGQYLGINSSGHVAYLTPSAAGMSNPMSSVGDMIVGGAAGVPTRLGSGSGNNGKWLTVSGGTPGWASLPASSGSPSLANTTITDNYTMDGSVYVIFANANVRNITLTLPSANAVSGKLYYVKRMDSSTHTITIGTASPFVNGFVDTANSVQLPTQYTCWAFYSDGSNWFLV